MGSAKLAGPQPWRASEKERCPRQEQDSGAVDGDCRQRREERWCWQWQTSLHGPKTILAAWVPHLQTAIPFRTDACSASARAACSLVTLLPVRTWRGFGGRVRTINRMKGGRWKPIVRCVLVWPTQSATTSDCLARQSPCSVLLVHTQWFRDSRKPNPAVAAMGASRVQWHGGQVEAKLGAYHPSRPPFPFPWLAELSLQLQAQSCHKGLGVPLHPQDPWKPWTSPCMDAAGRLPAWHWDCG